MIWLAIKVMSNHSNNICWRGSKLCYRATLLKWEAAGDHSNTDSDKSNQCLELWKYVYCGHSSAVIWRTWSQDRKTYKMNLSPILRPTNYQIRSWQSSLTNMLATSLEKQVWTSNHSAYSEARIVYHARLVVEMPQLILYSVFVHTMHFMLHKTFMIKMKFLGM